jgi:hypothetical protein
MTNRNTLVLHHQWGRFCDEHNLKPGLSRGFLNAVILCFPVSSVIWAGIIYAASRLVR